MLNIIDVIAIGIALAWSIPAALLLAPCIRTVRRERRDHMAYIERKKAEETEAKNHGFN